MDSLYRLTEAERNAIAEGLEDVKEGRVYSSEAAEIRQSSIVNGGVRNLRVMLDLREWSVVSGE